MTRAAPGIPAGPLLCAALSFGCQGTASVGDGPGRDPEAFPTPTPRFETCTLPGFEPPAIDPEDPDPPAPPPIPDYRCGTIDVPIDYARPRGDTLPLAFAVLDATDAEARRGALFVNPGGPGLSGRNTLAAIARSWPPEVLAAYDIVAFDPRGVGASQGPACDVQVEGLRMLDPLPDSAAAYQDAAVQMQAALDEFVNDGACIDPKLAVAMGTANVVRDLEVLRRALGESEASFVGRSYGAWLGAVWATQYPDHVDRVLLDAPPPPSADIRKWVLALARAQQTALEATVAGCPAACELGDGDFITELEGLLDELHREPRKLDGAVTDRLTGVDVVRALAQLPYADLDARRVLLRNVARLRATDPEIRIDAEREVALVAAESSVGLVRADTLAVLCADQTPALSSGDVFEVIETLRLERNLYTSFGLFFLGACPAFSTNFEDPPVLGAVHEIGDRLEGRVAVVGATHDSVTPFAFAQNLSDAIPGASLLAADHDRHGSVYDDHNGCVQDLATAVLLGAPAMSSTCPYEADYDEPCPVLTDRACRPGFKCGVYGNTTIPRCLAFEPGDLGQDCATTEFCGDGLHCTDVGAKRGFRTCQSMCTGDADCATSPATNQVCSVVLPDIVGTCALACDPWGDDCPGDLECKRLRTTVDGRGVAHCVGPGFFLPGVGCNESDACSPGYTCRADMCVQLCDDTHPCDAGSCVPAGQGALGHCG